MVIKMVAPPEVDRAGSDEPGAFDAAVEVTGRPRAAEELGARQAEPLDTRCRRPAGRRGARPRIVCPSRR
jgi:hypothetical protein